ncbi:ATP-binding cassette ATPase Uup [Moritella yayanosii]|uniref:ATP-binding protein Uup n=1 Tax=Moritella yayanosii TaxID=69539 RepID=A0A330LJB4_9GAMM|nr:ABC transporter ATP-binding protein [Moritella yayanosii]SQD77217.1 fused ATP-binding subunits of ABC superfamily protein involved in precise excision of transposons [Moritella yayanosii]
MAVITLQNACLAFGDLPLLNHADAVFERKERVCLVGRNGAGKSTMMKVIAGDILLDDGVLRIEQDAVVSRLEQDPPKVSGVTIFDFVASGLADIGQVLKDYHHQSILVADDYSEKALNKLMRLQEELDNRNGWEFEQNIEQVLTRLDLDPEMMLDDLSGGWLRRAALARSLACKPDILLLDEPTNHLDIESILWLEEFLKDFAGTIIFVSHDRSFIRSMATRIIDIDRGNLSSFPGDYDQYLVAKEEALRVEDEQNALFDKRLAQEEVWIRQGVKARRTRNEGRVKALKEMRNERSERLSVQGKAKITVDETSRSGKRVFDGENVTYAYGNKQIVKDFTFNIMRGDKIAFVGPNGCGKSTLIKLLLEELQPQSGVIKCGTKLEVSYFDQHRTELDLEKTVIDNLGDGKQEVMVNGKPRHILGYLQDFLFHPQRARTPVKALSGGERNRLLLAKLFLKPSNILIMDEPTNDLDIETLELLEELLANYQGTLLLVSHDRDFIDNTVTSCWMFDGNGNITNFVGGYHDAKNQQANAQSMLAKPKAKVAVVAKPVKQEKPTKAVKTKKLPYNIQVELDKLPAKMEQLEELVETLQAEINQPDFFSKPADETKTMLENLANKEQELETAFARWEELEEMKG